MDSPIGRVMVRFLEYLKGANPGLFHNAIAVVVKRRSVNVHSPYRAIPFPNGIDRAHRLRNEIRPAPRMLAKYQNQSFVPEVFKGFDLSPDLLG